MAIATKYICDKCGVSQDSNDDMWTVIVGIVSTRQVQIRGLPYARNQAPDKKADWCRRCCAGAELAGIKLGPKDLPLAEPAKAPTLEELICEIAAEAAHEAVQT